MADNFVITQGRIVLFKRSEDGYSPALITQVNDDSTVNLTIFYPSGAVGSAMCVERGDQVGKWVPPGIANNNN